MRALLTPHTRAVVQLAVTIAVLALVEVVLLVDGPITPLWIVLLFPATALVYLAAGVTAVLRRPNNRTGTLLISGAVAWLLAGLANTGSTVLVMIGLVTATLPIAIVLHLLHGFPSGLLHGTASRVIVAGGYVTALVLQAPFYLFGVGFAGPPYDALLIADRPGLADAGGWAQDICGSLVIVATGVLLAGRLRAASPARRRVLGPLFAYGIFAVVFALLSAQVTEHVLPDHDTTRVAVQLGLFAGVPIAFAASVLLGGFARMGEVEELGAWLGADTGGRPTLEHALAQTLGDPSLELVLWVPEAGGYVGFDGTPAAVPEAGTDRAVVEVLQGERRVGAIVYDAALIAERDLVEAAARLTAIALDHERLTVEVTASRDALRRSRERIVHAADDERRRIARDLHDGLQARLVVLAIGADGLAGDRGLPDATRRQARGLRTGLEGVVAELRALVQGVMPAALIERGLPAATEDLADRMPLPTTLTVDPALAGPDAKLPARVELAGYFVVAEALTNAVKHADASELTIHLGRRNGDLRIEVADDGVGGATAGPGAGMRGMADRIDVLGGHLTVISPPGGGTRVVAEVPCAS